jgi:CheY-like chemotaxis protein
MAIFRKSRRQRASGASDASPGGDESAARPAPPAETLPERLREIAAAAAVPEDALEPALRAISETSRAHAAAVCVFDSRHAILRLVAEVGLTDEGCRRLRSVRRGDPSAWDMPLQGLLNRRAYLIENASRNRYVPRLVEHASAVRSIACLPLYSGPAPIGSLILIALSPRSFGERDIRLLERGVAELASMIEAVRRRGGVPDDEPASAPPSLRVGPEPAVAEMLAERDRLRAELAARLAERAVAAAEVTARTGELDRLRAALEAATAERTRLAADLEHARRDAERAAGVAAALEAAERDRQRLAAALEAAAAERAERGRIELALEQARATAERAAAAATAELEALRRAAVATDGAVDERSEELAAELGSLRARTEHAEAALARERALAHDHEQERARLTHELRAANERERRLRDDLEAASGRAAAGNEDAVRHALETVRRAEEARAAAAAEAEAAHTALASTQEIVLALEDEAARANAEIERLAAAVRANGGEYDRLEIGLAETRARELAATTRVTELTREVDALQQENVHLTAIARERETELAALVARLEGVAAERDRLRATAETAVTERDRLRAAADSASAARTGVDEALARERGERARLNAALSTAQAALGELEASLSRREAEVKDQAAEIERLRDELARVRTDVKPMVAPVEPVPHVREPVRVVTVGTPAPARTRARDVEPGQSVVAVLDVDEAWSRVRVEGHQVVVLTPGEEVVDEIAGLVPARIVANLAIPGALGTLAALRRGGAAARFWGCIADAESDRALPLGMIDPTTSPLDPDAIVEMLGRYAVRGTRVVTAGADVDGLMSLRQALARRGMSVSMAWDAKQASDLLVVVRPEVVVVDLALPRRDGYAVLARLGTVDPIPSAVVVAGTEDPAPGFAAALNDPGNAGRAVPLSQLLEAVVARSEAAPVEKRHKVRAAGRK